MAGRLAKAFVDVVIPVSHRGVLTRSSLLHLSFVGTGSVPREQRISVGTLLARPGQEATGKAI